MAGWLAAELLGISDLRARLSRRSGRTKQSKGFSRSKPLL